MSMEVGHTPIQINMMMIQMQLRVDASAANCKLGEIIIGDIKARCPQPSQCSPRVSDMKSTGYYCSETVVIADTAAHYRQSRSRRRVLSYPTAVNGLGWVGLERSGWR